MNNYGMETRVFICINTFNNLIIKALQQNTTKKFKINGDETDEGKPNSMEFDENIENVKQSSFESHASNLILKLIEELGYILISNNINNNLGYEITFVNYEKKLFDFKRQSTFIKVTGNEKIKGFSSYQTLCLTESFVLRNRLLSIY